MRLRQFHYRKVPVLKRLIPSVAKRLEKFFWPNGRIAPVYSVQLSGIDAAALHLFGDSHYGLFAQTPGVVPHYIGPITMHRIGRDGIGMFQLDTAGIHEGDALGFIFGEIDTRVHMADQRKRHGRDPTEIIERLTSAYFKTLDEVHRKFAFSPIIVFSIVPPAGYWHSHFDPSMPRNGSDSERIAWSRQLNERLWSGAAERGFGFVDQYTPFATKKGLIDKHLSSDGVHVTPQSIKADIVLNCVFANRKP